jgi:hypothetical protein
VSARLRSAAAQRDDCFELLDALRTRAAQDHPWVDAAGLSRDLVASVDCLCGVGTWKFSFLDKVPYLIVRCRHRPMAALFLRRCNEIVARGDVLHRVAKHFVHPTSELRRDFEDWIDHGMMSARLDMELGMYEWSRIDETPIEAAHRDVKMEKQRAHGMGHAGACATIRRVQLEEDVRSSRAAGGKRWQSFLLCWKRWKLSAEIPMPSNLQLRISRGSRVFSMLPRPCINSAYRIGSTSFEEWGFLKKLFSEKPVATLQLTDVQRLVRDYLEKAMENNEVYSVPHDGPDDWELCVSEATPLNEVRGIDGDISCHTLELAHPGRRFFKVLDQRPHLKKTVRTDEDSIRGICTWQVMPMGTWAASATPTVHDLRNDGVPLVCDITTWEPWPCFRVGLRHWVFNGVSDVVGSYAYENHGPINWMHDADIHKLPLSVVLDTLGADGWRAGLGLEDAHVDSDLRFLELTNGFTTRPSYYKCLYLLDEMFTGGLHALHCGQTEAYYLACLALEDKSIVLPNLSAKQYLQWMSQNAAQVPLTLLGVQPERKRRRHGAALADEPMGAPVLLDAPSDDEPMAALDDALADSSEGEPMGVAEDPPVVAEAVADDVVVGIPDVVGPPAWFADMLAEIRAADVPDQVGGQTVFLNSCCVPTSGPPYIRKRVHCPKHPNCFKNRNITFGSTFGHLEVVGYLGSWLDARDDVVHGVDKSSHMRFKPSLRQVETWLRASTLI